MLTVDMLRAWGADTDDGMRRCMNNEAFYLRLADRTLRDDSFDRLKEAVEAKDRDRAFELAHALKGVTANLSLTPVQKPVTEMSDLLKAQADTDLSGLLAEILSQREKLLKQMD